jgi:hypothetical protein
MCKRSCCPPQHSSATAAIIAVITAIIIAPALLSALTAALRLIALTVLAAAVLAVAATVVLARRNRLIRHTGQAITPARPAPALPPVRVLVIDRDPATGHLVGISPGRLLTGTENHIARQLAALADGDPPAADLTPLRRSPRT